MKYIFLIDSRGCQVLVASYKYKYFLYGVVLDQVFHLFVDLKEAVEDVLPSLMDQGVSVLLMSKHSDTPGIQSFSDQVEAAPDAPIPRSLRSHVTLRSPAVYIYTSGTTGTREAGDEFLSSVVHFALIGSRCVSGLPKAAVLNQNRLLAALAALSAYGVTSEDVKYVNLPLYHTAGFLVGFIGSIQSGELERRRRWPCLIYTTVSCVRDMNGAVLGRYSRVTGAWLHGGGDYFLKYIVLRGSHEVFSKTGRTQSPFGLVFAGQRL